MTHNIDVLFEQTHLRPKLSIWAWEQGTSSPDFVFSWVCSVSTEEGTNTGSAGSSWPLWHQRSTCISTRSFSTSSSLSLLQPGRRCCSRSMWKEWPMTAAHLTSDCSSGLSWSIWFTAISEEKEISNEWVFYQQRIHHVNNLLIKKKKGLFFLSPVLHSAKSLERTLSPCLLLSPFLIHYLSNNRVFTTTLKLFLAVTKTFCW